MLPSRNGFTSREARIIRELHTPTLVQRFLGSIPYNIERVGETLRSFRGVLRYRVAHCFEASLFSAVVLEQHGYHPLLLDLESQDRLDHVLYLFQQNGRWGTIGRSRVPGLHGRRPVFKSVRALVESYVEPFVDLTGRIVGYGVYDLTQTQGYSWRLSRRNVWKMQEILIAMEHQRYHMGERRYRFWYDRFVAYRRRYPDRMPLYYPHRRTWLPGYPKV